MTQGWNRIAGVGLVLWALCTVSPAGAADWTVWGGRTVGASEEAMRVNLGWPGVDVSYHFLFDQDFELAPKASFIYGLPAVFGEGNSCCGFGLIAGSEARWAFFSQNGFSMAVHGDMGLILNLASVGGNSEGVGTGLRLGPGLAVDYSASSDVNIVGGIDLPIDILFEETTLAVMPFLLRTGMEFHPTQEILVFVMVGMGPAVLAGGDFSTSGFGLSTSIGMAHKF